MSDSCGDNISTVEILTMSIECYLFIISIVFLIPHNIFITAPWGLYKTEGLVIDLNP